MNRGCNLTCYASSVAMEIVARSLAEKGACLGLVHPTFDNIPDILRGLRLELFPLSEQAILTGDGDDICGKGIDCIFITTPNNPTGAVLPADRLSFIAAECERRGLILILDTSFRGFDPRAQYDHYEILERSGCRYIVIEDTGKLWPTLDLKVGFLVSCRHIALPLARIHSDILLNVSPLVLRLVERFAQDAANGGLAELQSVIAQRRGIVRSVLSPRCDVTFPDLQSRVSVERVQVGEGGDGIAVWTRLKGRGVHVLPCRQFHWANGDEGDPFIRIALARPAPVVEAAAHALASALEPA